MAAAISSARSGGVRRSLSPTRTSVGTEMAARLGLESILAMIASCCRAKPSMPTVRLMRKKTSRKAATVMGPGSNADRMENRSLTRIFVGQNGIRAGWRLLMFAAIVVGLLYGKLRLYGMLHVHVPSPGDQVNFPGYDGANAAVNFILVVMATLIMSKLERRPFDVYGLPSALLYTSGSASACTRVWTGASRSSSACPIAVIRRGTRF